MMEILVLISSVFLGVAFSHLIRIPSQMMKLLLAFSGAFFLGITVLEILPHVFLQSIAAHTTHQIGMWILAGVLVQYILETISKGIEHGHVHLEQSTFPKDIFIGLFLHSFIEGIPVANEGSHHFLWAIFVHNIPVSIILFQALRSRLERKSMVYGLIVLFAIAAPLGFVLGKYTLISEYANPISALVCGIFLHISTVILFEATAGHKFNLQKFTMMILGFALAWASVILLPHHHV